MKERFERQVTHSYSTPLLVKSLSPAIVKLSMNWYKLVSWWSLNRARY
jgi:hypothetical protein